MLGSSSSSATGNNGSSGNNSSSGNTGRKKISDTYASQIAILRLLSGGMTNSSEGRHYQIHEIAELSGLRDERETQRFLYILEGQKLVSPHPSGDFTSRHWYITKEGVRALKSMETEI